ncbi:MAG: hypothetical protein ACRD3W_06935, partial [Terriglobales bacterium]
ATAQPFVPNEQDQEVPTSINSSDPHESDFDKISLLAIMDNRALISTPEDSDGIWFSEGDEKSGIHLRSISSRSVDIDYLGQERLLR